jgi:hypothetical protein
VYDYIDALDDAVSSGPLSPQRRAVHRRLLHEEPTAVIIASSDVLQSEVARARAAAYIITTTELEALILENQLIKKHQPQYNIRLKDDKTYPFIKVTVQAGSLTHYYMARSGFPHIYMATYFTTEPDTLGLWGVDELIELLCGERHGDQKSEEKRTFHAR